jgi:hypothetical protein
MPAVTLSVKKVRCRIILWQALLEREANADKIFKRLSDQGYKPDASVLINMVYTLSFMVVMPFAEADKAKKEIQKRTIQKLE